ncbi:DUF6634 family protein [Bosea rubneri]|uniref:DUF6634 family protein n=1 Tax=Bosea rubneri TaxID=3075434 RepID=A0ABU3SBD2_9HYPH|nr:DUF6634 family protein [Bosea sp. ZW T0_25]MDU0342064.1 DUF6634 family protein [Bosea sp. ZW T0_25]
MLAHARTIIAYVVPSATGSSLVEFPGESSRNGIPMDPIDLAWAERRAGLELEIERLTRLVADLKLFCATKAPASAELATAPMLDRWLVTSRPAYCLVGEVSGHPLLAGSGRRVVTSDLVVIDGERGWARTRSRWYRLGTHIKSTSGG